MAATMGSVCHEMSSNLPLNQEAHTCSTAHALCAVVSSRSARSASPLDEAAAIRIYEMARELEGARSRHAPATGSSGLMACKAAQKLGLIREYHHAFGLDQALRALTLGPVMTGFSWYSSFDEPDEITGQIHIEPDAVIRGGHEVVAYELDTERELVWCWNSWGPGYGLGGRFCMDFDTWGQLLEEGGDVTVPLP
ncbi:MAG TPA: hypothetical protein VLL27_14250 [Solirubrobacterales bacterium]|nr:hypothetical protein [Solirubrobacterales bacterium]